MLLRSVLIMQFKITLDKDKVIDGLLKTKLFNEKSLLLLWRLLKEVLKIPIPYLRHLSIERLPSRRHTHINKDLAHEEVVQCHIWVLRFILGTLQVRLL